MSIDTNTNTARQLMNRIWDDFSISIPRRSFQIMYDLNIPFKDLKDMLEDFKSLRNKYLICRGVL